GFDQVHPHELTTLGGRPEILQHVQLQDAIGPVAEHDVGHRDLVVGRRPQRRDAVHRRASEAIPTTLRSGRASAAPSAPGKPGPMPPPRTLTSCAGVCGAMAISTCLVLVTPSEKTSALSGSACLISCISRGPLIGVASQFL